MTLTEFLRVRIAEDEARARAAMNERNDDGHWRVAGRRDGYDECRIEGDGIVIYDEGGHDHDQALHIAAWDPARVLAECKANRVWVEEYERWSAAPGTHASIIWAAMRAPMFHLAAVYADHPDYRQEWKP